MIAELQKNSNDTVPCGPNFTFLNYFSKYCDAFCISAIALFISMINLKEKTNLTNSLSLNQQIK